MRKSIKKTFVSILLATAIATSVSPVLASKITVKMPHTIYETKKSEHLSSGVVHEKVLKFTTAGWWNLNVLRINLSDPHTNVGALVSSKGLSSREKVSSMVQNSGAIAGINGDFFDFAPLPSVMGSLIDKGEVLASPIELAYAAPTFFIDELNQAAIDYLDRSMSVTNKRMGQLSHIYTINKTSKTFENITLLNRKWGSRSIGNKYHKDLIEIVVDNDKVTDVRIGKGPVDIPVNGYILAVRGVKHQGLANYGVGDEIDLKIATKPNIQDLKFAIGGGSIILQNGQLASTNINIKGNQPRTGIGISKDGKEIILVTIDGRDSSFKGVSQEIFGAILKDLGAYNGINLDGGGSTTMAVKPVDEKTQVANRPSDGGERPVVNGVGVFSNAPVGELSYIKVSTDDSNMFIDTSRSFSVKGFDQYHNPVSIDDSKLTFTHEGPEGTIEGNRFKATSSGKATITALYEDDISSSTELHILGTVKHISSDLESFNVDLNGEKQLPVFTARDGNGYTAKVHPRDINFTTTNDIGKVSEGVFHSGESSLAGALTAKLGDGVSNILVSVGSNATLIEGFENLDTLKFSSYPENVTGGIGHNGDFKEGAKSLSLKYDFSASNADTRAAYLNFTNGNSALPLPSVPRKLGLWVKGDSKGSWLRATIKDKKGNAHTLDFAKSIDFEDWRYLTTDIPSNVSYPLSLERIYIVETDSQKKHSGEILIDGLTASYPPTVGTVVLPTPSSLKDEKNTSGTIAKDGFSIGVTVEPKALNDIVKYDAASKVKSRVNKHRISAFLGGVSNEFTNGLTNSARINTNNVYSKNFHQDVAFINLNTAKNGIMSTDIYQWNKLKADLKDISSKNIILFSSSPIFGNGGFADKLEADLLHTHLVQARESGKNIFMVHGGSSTTTDLKDGVRYIGLNSQTLSKAEDIYNLSIVEFTVNGPDVTYEINPLFPKPGVKSN